jgi:hypothetical protein
LLLLLNPPKKPPVFPKLIPYPKKGKNPKEKLLLKPELPPLSLSEFGVLSPFGLFGILNFLVLSLFSSLVYIGIKLSFDIGFLQFGHFALDPFDSNHYNINHLKFQIIEVYYTIYTGPTKYMTTFCYYWFFCTFKTNCTFKHVHSWLRVVSSWRCA